MAKRKQFTRSVRRKATHHRNINSYDRPGPTRKPNKSILIVCEGAETEPNYFKDLRRHLKLTVVDVKIEERGGAPISIINKALQLVNERKEAVKAKKTSDPIFDEVWCVFDVENPHKNNTFEQAVNVADQQKQPVFLLGVSNPAFEFWYILHYEHTTRVYANGKEAKEHLCHHIPGYSEAMPIFTQVVDSTEIAYNRAKRLTENHPGGDGRFPNPSTSIYLLVKEMINLSPSGQKHFRLE